MCEKIKGEEAKANTNPKVFPRRGHIRPRTNGMVFFFKII